MDCETQLKELWDFQATFFAKDPQQKKAEVRRRIDAVLAAVEGGATKVADRARNAYIRGRALDAGEAYSEVAEQELSRSLKLEPEAVEAWAALGHVLWKKGDHAAARDAFESALAKDPNNVRTVPSTE